MSDKALYSAKTGTQISVFLEDAPGTLAGVAERLGKSGINIHALTLAEGLGHGYVRMVVDKPDVAHRVLKEAGELVMEREVLLLELSNAPGSLGRVARALGDAGINLEYVYCAGGPSVDKGLVVVKVDDTKKALDILGGLLKG